MPARLGKAAVVQLLVVYGARPGQAFCDCRCDAVLACDCNKRCHYSARIGVTSFTAQLCS